ncbi:allantoate amidohydrolase [[Clostridium] ultunense Esp]|nr:allantoate amidohydrolase [[Clostridium] ultunense Esp]
MADEHLLALQISDKDRFRFAGDIAEAIEWLAGFGADESGGVTRLLYSDAWIAAQEALAEKMLKYGLKPYYDDCGNLFGCLQGRDEREAPFLTGSHLDTVTCGGKYDGAYGILAAMIAIGFLYERFGTPLRTLEVVSLCEEEGSRFPLTCWGSGNICGKYDIGVVPPIHDKDGVFLKEAMECAGFGLGRFAPPRREKIAGFIELHIEQGFILEREKRTLGIVDGIVGQKRFTVRVEGITNHAGTTPMKYRRDALAGSCEMISWLEREALLQGGGMVATTGQIRVHPNNGNVIPGEVVFSVDVRDMDAGRLDRFCQHFQRAFSEIAEKRRLTLEISEWMSVEPIRMHEGLNRIMASICEARNFSYLTMYSGAGHDAQVFQSVCPTTMIFVPSRGGISHSPLEYSKPEDLADGIAVLTEWLFLYGYKEGFR